MHSFDITFKMIAGFDDGIPGLIKLCLFIQGRNYPA